MAQLPWYKSRTALIGTLIISILIVLKSYAYYVSAQEQKQTKNRIVELHTLDSLYTRLTAKSEHPELAEFNTTVIDKPLEKQARSILADTKASQKQRKLAQTYLKKYANTINKGKVIDNIALASQRSKS